MGRDRQRSALDLNRAGNGSIELIRDAHTDAADRERKIRSVEELAGTAPWCAWRIGRALDRRVVRAAAVLKLTGADIGDGADDSA
jgi:hypothetical protein